MDRLLFGISGIPHGDGTRRLDYAAGVAHLAALGLDAMELPFVRSVNVTDKNREKIRRAAEKFGVALSAHGSYYVNLNARDAATRAKSLARLQAAAKALAGVGGEDVVFHPGYYLGDDPAKAAATISASLDELCVDGATYCLETTGKPTQFGTTAEIVALCRTHPSCRICVDFAHVHARGNGRLRGYDDFAGLLDEIGRGLGAQALENLHMHVSGIAYSARGELRHLPLAESDLDFRALLRALKTLGVRGRLIVESPLLERDALLLRRVYATL